MAGKEDCNENLLLLRTPRIPPDQLRLPIPDLSNVSSLWFALPLRAEAVTAFANER